ncbi:RING finger protein 122-like isoform X1 [Carassius auratus]|uniref:RING finger protein 122-like isoform X1 n=1 Tax=Carassius auratus TaxID=7957 RepID=A0A6P6KV73_CARAU|nr:RING finger protein 122-like isoform X1 [Carassius auratus]
MPPVTSQELPLNIYVVIFGSGILVFVLSLIFCCFFISKLRHQAYNVRAGYKLVVFENETTWLHAHVLTCAVCLEDFRTKDELGVLPCQHAFHKRVSVDLSYQVSGEVAGSEMFMSHVQQPHQCCSGTNTQAGKPAG